MATVIREQQAAERLGVSPRTLQRWRVQGCGPVFVKLGAKLVAYTEESLERFLADSARQSTSAKAA